MKIFLTPQCNLNYIYCFKNKRKKAPKVNEILLKINKAKKKVIFKGGEPLLRKDILQILRYAKSRNLKVGLETNGILLNKKYLRYINEVYFVFDTIDFKAWKKITRKTKSEFKTTIKAIKLAKRLRKKVYIDSLLTELNFNSLEETKEFCKKNNLILRILENPRIPGFKYSNAISLPIKKAKFLGKNIIYIKAKKRLLNKEKLKYYKKRGKNAKEIPKYLICLQVQQI